MVKWLGKSSRWQLGSKNLGIWKVGGLKVDLIGLCHAFNFYEKSRKLLKSDFDRYAHSFYVPLLLKNLVVHPIKKSLALANWL